MTIRHYSSLDTGAPALPSTSGQRFIDNLKLVLKACLVDGYGAKPAAGWTVGHEHADGFSLGNGEGFINFVAGTSAPGTTVAVYIMETVTDGSTPLASGYNRRSGPWADDLGSSSRHFHYAANFSAAFANKSWCVVADEYTVTFQWFGSSAAINSGAGEAGILHFGRYFPAIGGNGFCALGGALAETTASPIFSPSTAAGTSLRNPFDGAVGQGSGPGYRAGIASEQANSVRVTKSKLAPGHLRPVRAAMVCRGAGLSGSATASQDTACGLLRGIVYDPCFADATPSLAFPALGVGSPVLADKVRPITLPNGVQWVMLSTTPNDLTAFVSLDPADWG